MAELATVARPYAEAAFELARDEQALPAWSEMLRLAATIVADARIAAALDNPRLDTGAKESLLLSIGGDRFNGEARNFIRVLVEAERVMLLPQGDDRKRVRALAFAGDRTAAGARKAVRQENRDDGHGESRSDRRRARDGRRRGAGRFGAGEARGDARAATRLTIFAEFAT